MLLCVDPPGSAAQKEEAEILFSALTNSSPERVTVPALLVRCKVETGGGETI